MSDLLPELGSNQRLANVFAIVKLYLEGRQPGTCLFLYRYTSAIAGTDAEATNWAAVKRNEFGKPELFLQATTIDPTFIKESTDSLLDLIHPFAESFPCIERVCASEIADVVHAYFDRKGSHPYRPFDERFFYCYASEEGKHRLRTEKVELPVGYEFFDLQPEQAEELLSVSLHADEDEVMLLKLRLATLPGVGVRCKASGELVAFEYTDGFGFLANLYTFPKFRHQGIGSAVEARLSQRILMELGLCPAKNVAFNRPRVVQMSAESSLWTFLCNEENGEKQVMRWGYLSKEPRPQVVLYEN
ncbi:Protein T10B10.4 a [Aphelenchoides avenae]|nr:Protein T10B10.4 a [Aphelenchus avenae]